MFKVKTWKTEGLHKLVPAATLTFDDIKLASARFDRERKAPGVAWAVMEKIIVPGKKAVMLRKSA